MTGSAHVVYLSPHPIPVNMNFGPRLQIGELSHREAKTLILKGHTACLTATMQTALLVCGAVLGSGQKDMEVEQVNRGITSEPHVGDEKGGGDFIPVGSYRLRRVFIEGKQGNKALESCQTTLPAELSVSYPQTETYTTDFPSPQAFGSGLPGHTQSCRLVGLGMAGECNGWKRVHSGRPWNLAMEHH